MKGFLFICLLFTICNCIDYSYFYPPQKNEAISGVGYIVGLNQGCVSYDAQGWSAEAVAENDGQSVNLVLYEQHDCSGSPQFNQTMDAQNNIYTIPFNKYDPNNRFMVGVYDPPFQVETVMVMQFYPENNQCVGQAPILKMFFNGTYFNSTDPIAQEYCDNDVPMMKRCESAHCQNSPYPSNCTQYFSNYIWSNFFCRIGVPTDSSSLFDYNNEVLIHF
ncbi:hypothetical protein CYY_003527 [Polysphondylium violaceum]|uniref:Uncharacterized protein n=1 Tax=Polysphondylium violaceum TaxID=133409 RepID=A0A8J4V8L3_9MYCE|nr:hypothetical protein CYY_003527 [Polysphondylium violaceum]